jgi:hypothetical protein
MVRCNATAGTIGRWRCPPLPAVGTEPTGGSPTGREETLSAIALLLTLVLLLMVVDRMRQ